MPQVPLGRFILLKDTIVAPLFDYLSTRPYGEVAGFCTALQGAPEFVVEDDQDIGIIPRAQSEPPEIIPEGDSDTDDGVLALVQDGEQEPITGDVEETTTGLPPMMKGKTG